MKTAILTFQFAHNYGALLQAYALKQYLKSHDLEGEIAPYYPDWAQSEYAISPFAKGISFRRRVRLASQYWKRKGQSEVFDKFISEELDAGDTFSSELELKNGWRRMNVLFAAVIKFGITILREWWSIFCCRL